MKVDNRKEWAAKLVGIYQEERFSDCNLEYERQDGDFRLKIFSVDETSMNSTIFKLMECQYNSM